MRALFALAAFIATPAFGLSVLAIRGDLRGACQIDCTPAIPPSWVTQGDAECADGRETYYPGLRGFAACTRGGFVSGTTVYVIDTLSPSGDGSIGEYFAADCPKVGIFEISGVIDFDGQTVTPNLCDGQSLVGESAPSPGIVLRDVMLRMRGDNWVISHVTIGAGDQEGWTTDRDVVQNEGNDGLLANVTLQWGVDEILHCYPGSNRSRKSVWQSVIVNPLDDSIHTEGTHGYGAITDEHCLDVDFIRNVMANHRGRSPLLTAPTAEVSNNVLYNVGLLDNTILLRNLDSVPTFTNVRHNVIIHGPNTNTSNMPIRLGGSGGTYESSSRVYVEGNYSSWQNCAVDCVGGGGSSSVANTVQTSAEPAGLVLEEFATSSARLAFVNLVLNHAGARPMDRLAHTQGVLDDVLAGYSNHTAGGLVDSVAEDGGWPSLESDTVDHSDSMDTHCGGAMPTGESAEDVMSSGLIRLHEWAISCADAWMPVGWRPLTLEIDE